MPTFHADYTSPTHTTTEAAAGACAAFQNEGAALFSGLGLGDGGFQANADRVFILDETNTLVTPTPYDAQQERNMAAAAQNGRLYIMDKDYHLRQVRLEGNEDDGFTFEVSKPLRARQIPRNSVAYFLRRFKGIIDDFVRDMSQIYNEMKSNMEKSFANMKSNMAKIFGGRNQETAQPELDVNAEPLLPPDEPLETQQTGTTITEDQIQQSTQSELTTEELLSKNPTKQTTPEFERYLTALADRGNGHLVDAALNKKDGKPEDYYEALAQELEGQIARHIQAAAPSEENPESRKTFLDDQKPIVATMYKDLREFVRGKVDPQLVADFYAQGLEANSDMGMKLQEAANLLQSTGINEYTADIHAQNEANQQMMQQSQSNVNQMQQNQPTLEPQAPSIGGMSSMR